MRNLKLLLIISNGHPPKLLPKMRFSDDDIRVFLAQGISQCQIAKIYHISPKRISRIANGGICKPRGAQKKFDDSHEQYVLELVYTKPRITTLKIIKLFAKKFTVEISKSTILRFLEDAGYQYRSPLRIPMLTPPQIIIRYNFACNLLEN